MSECTQRRSELDDDRSAQLKERKHCLFCGNSFLRLKHDMEASEVPDPDSEFIEGLLGVPSGDDSVLEGDLDEMQHLQDDLLQFLTPEQLREIDAEAPKELERFQPVSPSRPDNDDLFSLLSSCSPGGAAAIIQAAPSESGSSDDSGVSLPSPSQVQPPAAGDTCLVCGNPAGKCLFYGGVTCYSCRDEKIKD